MRNFDDPSAGRQLIDQRIGLGLVGRIEIGIPLVEQIDLGVGGD